MRHSPAGQRVGYKHNINVNAIAQYMKTNNTQAQLRADEQRSSEILDRIPRRALGLPADLMGPVVPRPLSLRLHQWLAIWWRWTAPLACYPSAMPESVVSLRHLSNYCPYAKVRIVHTWNTGIMLLPVYKQGLLTIGNAFLLL